MAEHPDDDFRKHRPNSGGGTPSADNPGNSQRNEDTLFPTDRYIPTKQLGQGALGRVYRCYDSHLVKDVAVKCLHLSTPDHVMSFQQEARIVSRLNHENVIKLLDFGTSKTGQPYMVMEHFDGRSLQEIIADQGKIPAATATEIFLQICSALKHLHGHDIYHRDLKPSNILVKFSDANMPWVKLIDFGLSKSLFQEQSGIELQGRTIVGTPAYMSPDQVEGNVFDATSEIYSLGCVLYEMYSGHPPFSGETALEVLNKHVNEAPPVLTVSTPEAPQVISKIIAKCLQKDRKKRYQSIAEIVDDWNEGQSGAGTMSATTTSSLPRKSALRWSLVVPLLVFVLIAATMAVMFVFQSDQNDRSTQSPIRFETLPSKISERYPNLDPAISEKVKDTQQVSGESLYVAQYADPLDDVELKADETLDSKADDRESITLRFLDGDDAIKKLAHRKSLRHLDLSQAAITDKVFAQLAALPGLNSLVINRTSVKTLDGIEKLPNLERLDLKNTQITDDSLLRVKSLKKLISLNLTATAITDKGVSNLVGMPKLQTLILASTSVTPKVADYLIRLPLQRVSLSKTAVDEKAVRKLADMKSVQSLSVTNCEKITNIASLEHDYPTISFEPNISLALQLFESANKQFHSHPDLAQKKYEECERLLENRYGKNPVRGIPVRVRLASLAISHNEMEKAKQIFDEVLPVLERRGITEELLAAIDLQSMMYMKTGPDKCLALTEKSMKYAEALHHPPEDLTNRYFVLGELYLRARRWKDAETTFRKCIYISERTGRPGIKFVGRSRLRLAESLRAQNRNDEAKVNYEKALDIFSKGDRSPIERTEAGIGYVGLTAILLREHKYPEALANNDNALSFIRSSDNAALVIAHSQRAVILAGLNRNKEAAAETAIARKFKAKQTAK